MYCSEDRGSKARRQGTRRHIPEDRHLRVTLEPAECDAVGTEYTASDPSGPPSPCDVSTRRLTRSCDHFYYATLTNSNGVLQFGCFFSADLAHLLTDPLQFAIQQSLYRTTLRCMEGCQGCCASCGYKGSQLSWNLRALQMKPFRIMSRQL
jgi:hypothetical protein